jgi:hypothetical protein
MAWLYHGSLSSVRCANERPPNSAENRAAIGDGWRMPGAGRISRQSYYASVERGAETLIPMNLGGDFVSGGDYVADMLQVGHNLVVERTTSDLKIGPFRLTGRVMLNGWQGRQ